MDVAEITKKQQQGPSRPLLQWVTLNTAPLGREFAGDETTGAIGVSVLQADRLERTIDVALESGRGLFIETEASRTQLDPDHPCRSERFKESELDWLEGQFRPGVDVLAADDRNDIVNRHLDAQVSRRSTILGSPLHRVVDGTSLSEARRAQLELDHDFAEQALARGAAHPTPQEGRERSIAVNVAVNGGEIAKGRAIAELVAAYKEFDEADIFFIWAWNFSPSETQYRALRYLCRLLQRESGKFCLLGGVNWLGEAALRNQVNAVCQGWGRGKLHFPPPEPPEEEVVKPGEEEKEKPGYAVRPFHPGLRGVTPAGEGGERVRRLLYLREPCSCGFHPPDEEPVSQPERHLHNLYWMRRLASEAVLREPGTATAEFGKILETVNRNRARYDLRALPIAWRTATRDPSDSARKHVPPALWLATG